MKKYLVLIKNHISMISAYKYELYFQWIYRSFYLLVLFYIWNLSATTKEESYRLICYYTLLMLIVDIVTTTRAPKEMSRVVQDGTFSNFLVKPISFPITQLLKLVSILGARLITPIILVVLLAFVRPDIFSPKDLSALVGFIVFLSLGFIMYQSFVMIVGAFSFWVQEIGFTLTVIDLLLNLVKGAWIPLYLYPEKLKTLLNFTPIPYFGGYPINVYQNGLPSDFLQSIFIAVFWIIVFILIFKVVYKKGVQRYEANGG